jgi:sugar lactone lactonase YvrE
VATDSGGNIYVADAANSIRKITPAAIVTTLAGSSGETGFADGTGSAARFNNPSGLAVDPAGNCYVADSGNHIIRKVTQSTVVTTIAGSPGQPGSADGSGSAARFNYPQGVALDSGGNLYVADVLNDTIRKITPSGSVSTLAGSAGQAGMADGAGSAAQFSAPKGVATDNGGNVYVADTGNSMIRKVTAAGLVTTLAGGTDPYGWSDGIGAQASFNLPQGITVDGFGTIYVADESNDMIRRIVAGTIVTTVAGSPSQEGSVDGVGSTARFYGPVGLVVDGFGNLYVADSNNERITKGTQAYLAFSSSSGGLTASNSAVHVRLTGPAGRMFILEASTDLRAWTVVQTNVLPAGGASLSVPMGANRYGFLRSRFAP